MERVKIKDLLDAGVHFGHLTEKWNPKMSPYIFMKKNGIHIIDLHKTEKLLNEAMEAIKTIVKMGRKILFVATKKQAKEIVQSNAQKVKMPYVTERWLGGMLTNFTTIRKSLRKMQSIDKMMKNTQYKNLSKREKLMISRDREKQERVLGGISELVRLPSAIFVIDIKNEHIAVREAHKLNIPIFALVDTNSNPNEVDFPIPGNDDSFNSIKIITEHICKAIQEGNEEKNKEKEMIKKKEKEEIENNKTLATAEKNIENKKQ